MSDEIFGTVAPTFTNSVPYSSTSTAAVRLLPYGVTGKRVVVLIPSTDCYIRFGDASVGAATSSYERFVAGVPVRLECRNDSAYVRVLRVSSDGVLKWIVESQQIPDTYGQILGSSLFEMWDVRSGLNSSAGAATSWTGTKGGISLAPSGAGPTIAVDGTNFLGRSVLKFVAGSSHNLQSSAAAIATALPVGSAPYIMLVGRLPTNGAFPLVSLEDSGPLTVARAFTTATNLKPSYAGDAGFSVVHTDVATSLVGCFEFVFTDGTNAIVSVNGDDAATGANATLTATAVTSIAVGERLETSAFGTANIAQILLCTSTPTSAQRYALRAAARLDWGY